MADMIIEGVDERDSAWELPTPRFRVYLHGSEESATVGRTDAYDITGADVLQVIDWAQRQAGDALTYAVALVIDDETEEQRNPGGGRGLVWLVGMDGNDDTTAQPDEAETQRRMLARRRDPVGIPRADQAPPGVPGACDEGIEQR